MKTKHLNLVAVFLFAMLFMTACRKSTIEHIEEAGVKSNLQGAKLENKCQLTFAVDWGGYPNWFHYNAQGLADEWRIDFGTGSQEVLTMQYDNDSRLANAQWHSAGRLFGTMEFVWTDNLITTEHWNIGGYEFDFFNTYNHRGQLKKRATSDGYLTTFDYTPEGNHLKDVIFWGDEPLQSDEYSYNQPNKNPLLAIQGLPYLFLYINPPQGKWFATGDKFTIYENGNPVVVVDTDPSKTVMQMTHQNYLSSATYFDNVSGAYLEKNFDYQNCGPLANTMKQPGLAPAASKYPINKNSMKPRPIHPGRPRQ